MARPKKSGYSDFSDVIFDNSKIFDEEEKNIRIASLSVNLTNSAKDKISTGLLVADLITGGGIVPGREYEIVGPEHGGKSTFIYSTIKSALNTIPNQLKVVFLDIEGSIDQRWFKNIVGIDDISVLFGVKDSSGSWVVKPQIRYYKPDFGEKGLILIERILRRLPNKILLDDVWYYMWEPKEPKIAKSTGGYTATELRAMFNKQGSPSYSKELFSKTGNFYVPVPNNYGGPELLICVDSWAAMMPSSMVEDGNSAMGAQARMFAQHLNNIKVLISNKYVSLIGSNQIRTKIAAYGDPEYSPGGNTKQHTTDCRLRFSTISNRNGSGKVEVDGEDEYRHFKIVNRKNKLFIPFKEGFGRWWIKHSGNSGNGPDPVQDTFEYLLMTNQLKQGHGFFTLNLDKVPEKFSFIRDIKFVMSKKKGYTSFKELILSKEFSFEKKKYRIDIRNVCFNQIKSGRGIDLYLMSGEEKLEEDDE